MSGTTTDGSLLQVQTPQIRSVDESFQVAKGTAQMVEDIGGGEGLLRTGAVGDRPLGRAAAEPGGEAGGVVEGHALRGERGAQSSEDVAHAA